MIRARREIIETIYIRAVEKRRRVIPVTDAVSVTVYLSPLRFATRRRACLKISANRFFLSSSEVRYDKDSRAQFRAETSIANFESKTNNKERIS